MSRFWDYLIRNRPEKISWHIRQKLPHGIKGTYLANGPCGRHPFDGDGKILKIKIDSDAQLISIENRKVNCSHANKHGLHVFMNGGNATLGIHNPGNTSIAYNNDHILAIWEQGAAYKINTDTLETLGQTNHVMAAHSRTFDGIEYRHASQLTPFGTLITIYRDHYHVCKRFMLWGQFNPFIHDMEICDRFYIFNVGPLRWDLRKIPDIIAGRCGLAEGLVYEPAKGGKMLLVGRDDDAFIEFDTGAGFVFHHIGCNDDGRVVYVDSIVWEDVPWACGTNEWIKACMPRWVRFSCDTFYGKCTLHVVSEAVEFPVKNSDGLIAILEANNYLTSLQQIVCYTFDVQKYRYVEVCRWDTGPNTICTEPFFVNSDKIGCIVHDVALNHPELMIFDVSKSEGPIMKITLPPINVHIHGIWIQE